MTRSIGRSGGSLVQCVEREHPMGAVRRLGVAAVATILLLTACSGAPSSSPTSPANGGSGGASGGGLNPPPDSASPQEKLDWLASSGLSGQARTDFLVEKAAAAGTIVMYGSQDESILDQWQDALNTTYPSLDIQILRLQDAAERMQAESQSGNPVTSIYDSTPADTVILKEAGALAKYVSPEAADFDVKGGFVDPDGFWTASNAAPMIAAFNTNLLTADKVPTTLEQLADPGFDIPFGRTSIGGRWVAAINQFYGDEKGMQILQGIAAHNPTIFESNSALRAAVSSGQIPLAIDTQYGGIVVEQSKGAPDQIATITPLFSDTGYTVIPKDAPNPYGGALLTDWVLSKDGGQKYLVGNRLGPRSDMDYGLDNLEGTDSMIAYGPALLTNLADDDNTFQDLFIRK